MKVPCYNCEQRQLGCHATCAAYKEYAAEREKIRENRARESSANGFTADHEVRNMKFRKRTGASRNSAK